LKGGETTGITTFADMPVVAGTRATVEVTDSFESLVLTMDIDNDGTSIIKTLGIPVQKQHKLIKILDKIERVLINGQKCSEKRKGNKCEFRVKNKLIKTINKFSSLLNKMSEKKNNILSAEEANELQIVITLLRTEVNE
jgi:hypothetical protein